MILNTAAFEAWFISSLANAGNCRAHTRRCTLLPTYLRPGRPYLSSEHRPRFGFTSQRHQHTKIDLLDEGGNPSCANPTPNPASTPCRSQEQITEVEEDYEPEPNRTREELMALVDQYSGESYTDQLPLLELPRLYQPSDGPRLTVSDNPEDEWPPPHHAWPGSPKIRKSLETLRAALRDERIEPEEIYQLYRVLPAPRAAYLDSNTRHKMLHHLAVVERKDEQSMLRYLSVVDDMKSTAIPLNSTEWTSAISFVSRYVHKSSAVEVEAALHMWREMEHTAGVQSTDATFNVLFDVACKAGKFTLAKMIYKEMEARGFEFNRYHHVSMIFYYGMQRNGDGARAAYRSLVEAGELVDTVVLNAMISALIRSKEPNAAENVYERMKKSYIERSGSPMPPKDFKSRRHITKVLMKMALIARNDMSKQEEFQRRSIIAPDLHTFRILINEFVSSGDLERTAKYLDEMYRFSIPVHGAIFNALLKGFAIHGGIRYTDWTAARLEEVWISLLKAMDDNVEGLYISKWMVVWALKAFAKCSGKSRCIEVWEEIKTVWDPGEADLDFVMGALRPLLEAADMAGKRKDWLLGAL